VLGPRAGALTAKVGSYLLTMMEGTVYGLEQVGSWLRDAVASRLKNVPEEKIVQPDPRIAVPAVQALIYSMDADGIREMFAELLAANMNSDRRKDTHPAFVEIVKEMTPAEAKLLQAIGLGAILYRLRFSFGDKWNEFSRVYSLQIEHLAGNDLERAFSNLQRLELLEFRQNEWPVLKGINDGAEDEIERKLTEENSAKADEINADEEKRAAIADGQHVSFGITKMGVFVTPFGQAFIATCLPNAAPAGV